MNYFNHVFGCEQVKNGIISVAFCPGWVQTDMGGPNAMLELDESITSLLETIGKLKEEDSGRYMDRLGKTIAF